MKQDISSHTEIFLPIMNDAFRYLLCYTPCITSSCPYLNGSWETADPAVGIGIRWIIGAYCIYIYHSKDP